MFASLSPEAVSESVVLLADEWLLQLPLEALKTFAVPQITSISRDFSLQFHYHRVHPAERSGNRYIYMSMYKSRAFSKRRLYSEKLDSLHLKKTPACLVVLFLSDLCISYFLISVSFIVLCLSRFFFFI